MRQLGKCIAGFTKIKSDANFIKIKSLVKLNLKDKIVDGLETLLIKLSV